MNGYHYLPGTGYLCAIIRYIDIDHLSIYQAFIILCKTKLESDVSSSPINHPVTYLQLHIVNHKITIVRPHSEAILDFSISVGSKIKKKLTWEIRLKVLNKLLHVELANF
jgi:hypothetical protein